MKPLFPTRAVPYASYHVSPDGQRFLINTPPVQATTQAPITVVVNWRAVSNKK